MYFGRKKTWRFLGKMFFLAHSPSQMSQFFGNLLETVYLRGSANYSPKVHTSGEMAAEGMTVLGPNSRDSQQVGQKGIVLAPVFVIQPKDPLPAGLQCRGAALRCQDSPYHSQVTKTRTNHLFLIPCSRT